MQIFVELNLVNAFSRNRSTENGVFIFFPLYLDPVRSRVDEIVDGQKLRVAVSNPGNLLKKEIIRTAASFFSFSCLSSFVNTFGSRQKQLQYLMEIQFTRMTLSITKYQMLHYFLRRNEN